jgi:Na+-translocating ferredoxin:NAD+ oxidoreductase subunit C
VGEIDMTDIMKLWRFHGGIHLPDYKASACAQPIRAAAVPPVLILPLLQHIGIPATPVVAVGERVLKGQVIATCIDHTCRQPGMVPIHASSSGTVLAIEARPVPHASGLYAPCIVIETDGKDEEVEAAPLLQQCANLSADELRFRIATAGIVGLGGAGFPSHIKLLPKNIDLLILNGAECEPYISCDDRLMRERPQQVILGGRLLAHVVGGARRCIIALEDNKPQAYTALCQHIGDQLSSQLLHNACDISVVKVPTLYPMGGERQLIQVLTGKEVPHGGIPAQLGIVVHNVETAAAAYRAVRFGQPLISRIITITGDAVAQPQNLDVRLGTPIHELLRQCGLRHAPAQLIMGGPMMGTALNHADMPVIKTTNCIIAKTSAPPPVSPMPCIRCGACERVCPVQLLPQQLYWYAKAKDFDKAEDYQIFDCIECGCCSYVCPSHLPLVHYYRYAKAEIRARRRDKEKAEHAKQRHEFRLFRLEREKQERQARHQQAATKISTEDAAHKNALIEDAVARVRAKRAAAEKNQ